MFHERKYNYWLFAGVLLVCFMVSMGVRFQQFDAWKKSPAAYFVGERPLMTTLDAPFWLRNAREYNEGTYGQNDSLRNYPDNTKTFKELFLPQKYTDPAQVWNYGIYDVPLLSFLIAHLSPLFDFNYYLTGTLLIPVLASLFILPMGIYFFQIGIPLSGLMGGLIGTFAGGYYMRSSIGRIDTDMLNLFFPTMTALLILSASLAKTERSILAYSAGSGFSLFLFQWWYNKPGFTLLFFIVLVFSLFIHRIRFRTILLSALLFLLFSKISTFMSGPSSLTNFLQGYFMIEEFSEKNLIDNGIVPATFPNVATTISEVDSVPMDIVFSRILSNILIDWIGFVAFFVMAVFRWRFLLPLVPMLALGILSFQSSNRFIMYLAPFIGIGLGWILILVIEGGFYLLMGKVTNNKVKKESKIVKEERLKIKDSLWTVLCFAATGRHIGSTMKDTDSKGESRTDKYPFWKGNEIGKFELARQWSLYLALGVFFWAISSQTAISFVPGPSIHPRLYATFLEVKKRVPQDSALLTWWDYGFALNDATGLMTFQDGGGLQHQPKNVFTARGLISPDADELYDITQFLATEGNLGIVNNNTSPEALLRVVRNPQLKPWNPIYLFFTADMTGKYGAISKIGSWDLKKGGSQPRGYQNLACNKITNDEMNCRGAKIDLKAGKINNQIALKRLLFIRDGKVLREQEFGHHQGYTLQLLVSGQQVVEVQLIDEVVFRSNYNQMFLLGRYRKDLFEETYNAFPFSRLYRVKF